MFARIASVLCVLLGASLGVAGEPDTSARPLPLPTAADHVRAGFPQCISKCAISDKNRHYMGGYVGGSCLVRGEGRAARYDGTFGYDYVPFGLKPGRIFLSWCHCRTKQPGAGTYDPAGPPIFDIFSVKPLQKAAHRHHERHEEGHE